MKITKQRQLELPHFVVGALATAGASLANGATVQITLTGNQISTSGGNQLNADVTGDGTLDFVIAGANTAKSVVAKNYGAFVDINGNRLSAQNYITTSGVKGDAQFALGGVGTASEPFDSTGFNIRYLNPISFTDSRINGGLLTNGFLEVNSISIPETSATVALTRLIFDDGSTAAPVVSLGETYSNFEPVSAVPEASSSLALLALGAGGLLTRRRSKRAA